VLSLLISHSYLSYSELELKRENGGKQSLSPHAMMLTIQQECILYTNSKLTGLETQLLVLKGVSSSNKIIQLAMVYFCLYD